MTQVEESPPESFQLLVRRPGRLVAVAVVATVVLAAGLVAGFFWGFTTGRGWWNLLLVIPGTVAFVAMARGGLSRCEVTIGAQELQVRSVDNATVLGRRRRAAWRWSQVEAITRAGRDGGALRIDFARAPRALVFVGSRERLEAMQRAVQRRLRA